MSFEKIGPYESTRGDLIAASLVISFMTGATSTRIRTALFVVVGLIPIAAAIVIREPLFAGLGVLYLLCVFILVPALRSRKRSKEIYLAYDPEGIVAETANIRTVYKWATVCSFKKVGSRLFIMISDGCALVISDRSISVRNMEDLMSTLTQHRQALEY